MIRDERGDKHGLFSKGLFLNSLAADLSKEDLSLTGKKKGINHYFTKETPFLHKAEALGFEALDAEVSGLRDLIFLRWGTVCPQGSSIDTGGNAAFDSESAQRKKMA